MDVFTVSLIETSHSLAIVPSRESVDPIMGLSRFSLNFGMRLHSSRSSGIHIKLLHDCKDQSETFHKAISGNAEHAISRSFVFGAESCNALAFVRFYSGEFCLG